MKPDTETWLLLLARIQAGDPLPPEARAWLVALLELVRHGEDPREFAGTKPGRGTKLRSRPIIGLHYWALRARYGRGGEAAARQEVATAWCKSSGEVLKIARKCKPLGIGLDSMTPAELDDLIESIKAEVSAN